MGRIHIGAISKDAHARRFLVFVEVRFQGKVFVAAQTAKRLAHRVCLNVGSKVAGVKIKVK